jgi:tellurite resistance protein TehA-like permease
MFDELIKGWKELSLEILIVFVLMSILGGIGYLINYCFVKVFASPLYGYGVVVFLLITIPFIYSFIKYILQRRLK